MSERCDRHNVDDRSDCYGCASEAYHADRNEAAALRSRLTEAEGLLREIDADAMLRADVRNRARAFLSRSTSSPPAPVDPVEAVLAVECIDHGAPAGGYCMLHMVCASRIRAALHHTATSEQR